MSDYTPVYLVFAADVCYFRRVARSYKGDALKLKNDDYGSCTPTFHLLSSLAFELFPKVLHGFAVCLLYKNDTSATEEVIRDAIAKKMSQYGHKLDELYNSFPEMMTYLGITSVTNFSNEFVWEYRFVLSTGEVIAIKDMEAVRYGTFAKNRDVATWCVNDHLVVDLLNKLEVYVEQEEKRTNDMLKGLSPTNENPSASF